ncbi:SIMPL domain-containing protein [Acinetobacter rudis]|uniref:SIMPL domain-containing protein n=1 Tax=Acinetobacter rudis TaxID=632955 RepID=A0AAW8J5J5_9GAMM|nr:SIMPL domain-containing protein [Acinetobacter rudis]MDQ8934439.1 SIMPL domain-containing protein [Acinetobacter rudis]MDQ8951866.1 SIMPL domain-containing protein [Acinetobacter rudis]MDQ9016661.1 SIMPL domain-containing protein [Acinetobacter rudis]
MRQLILTSLLAAGTFSSIAHANSNNDINYNIVSVQAEASRDVVNDEMLAVLFIEKSNKQPAVLANEINQLMNQATQLAKKYPQVKIKTDSQNTYPVYDNDNRKLKEWRSRANIRLESSDFKATSQLISELQQNFQTESINFNVSDAQRTKVENELMVEASKGFQQRAQTLSQAWNKSGYNLVNLNINTRNSYPQPVMMLAKSARFAEADAGAPQNMEAGESKITVSANGSIQFK